MHRLAVLLIIISYPAFAETFTGSVHVVDGDTIYVGQTRLRLRNIDAFEAAQNCERNGQTYACGEEATRALIKLVGQRFARCEGEQRDRYKRPLVHCWIDNVDLGQAMVRQGWAVAEYGGEYHADERKAQLDGAGAWAGKFARPRDWRRLTPR